MTPIARNNDELRVAQVICLGEQASKVATDLQNSYPISVASAGLDAAALAGWVSESINSADTGSVLPAVLIVADTTEAAQVLSIIESISQAEYRVRPRIWPAFISGKPGELKTFDAQLTSSGQGAADLVLMLNSAVPAAQADALAAWLKIKMPAPASVLAELPDSEGRICRYVALGCETVTATAGTYEPSVTQTPEFDLASVQASVRAQLVTKAASSVAGAAAKDAAGALGAAAQAANLEQLLAAEQHLTESLTAIDLELPAKLSENLTELVQQAIESPATDLPAAQEVPAGTRNQYLSELITMLTKGGLGKLFGRSRTATLTESITHAALADVQRGLAAAVESVAAQVPDVVNEVVAATQLRNDEKRAAALERAERERTTKWQGQIRSVTKTVNVWPTVSTAGITRAWGGPIPAPRTYVVTNTPAALINEDDEMITVIDLRDSTPAKAVVDLRDNTDSSELRAHVLLAQYSLPLAAFS